jgi:peptidoglycan/xylan/chitin deacetylase (PgdA/CDA1 family)
MRKIKLLLLLIVFILFNSYVIQKGIYINNSIKENKYSKKLNKEIMLKKKVSSRIKDNVLLDSSIAITENLINDVNIDIEKKEKEKDKLDEKLLAMKKQPIINDYKTAYLTFDDGPSWLTPEILDILKKHNAHATFFVVNAVDNYKDVLNRMVNEGHTIGLHSATHKYDYIYSSEQAYFDDLNRIKDSVKRLTGYNSTLIRFPGGSSNTVSAKYNKGIMSRLTKEVQVRGFYYHDWNVDSGDAAGANADRMISNIERVPSDKKYVNVLMHDAGSKRQTVLALDRIITYYEQNGYHLEALKESSPCVRHAVNN